MTPGTFIQVKSPYHNGAILWARICRIKEGDASPYPIVCEFADGIHGQYKESEILDQCHFSAMRHDRRNGKWAFYTVNESENGLPN